MPTNWNAGVIGCGAIVQALHVPGYLATPGVTLAAACDPEPARHAEVKKLAPGIRLYRDHREMLKAEKLDVVSVATPNRFHAEHAIAALEAGANVILEKPAALSLKEIAAIKAAVRANRKQLIVGFSHRFQVNNLKIRELLDKKAIGEPYMIRVRMAHGGPFPGWARDDWFYDPKDAGGGALLDMGIHCIDQVIWLLGRPTHVQAAARTLRKPIKVDDNALLLLEFPGKAMGYIEVGWTSPAGFWGMEIMGDRGYILNDYVNGLTLTTGKASADLKAKLKLSTKVLTTGRNAGGWPVEIQEIVKHLRKGSDRGHGIDAGGAALAVALAAYESSKTGKRVKIAYK